MDADIKSATLHVEEYRQYQHFLVTGSYQRYQIAELDFPGNICINRLFTVWGPSSTIDVYLLRQVLPRKFCPSHACNQQSSGFLLVLQQIESQLECIIESRPNSMVMSKPPNPTSEASANS